MSIKLPLGKPVAKAPAKPAAAQPAFAGKAPAAKQADASHKQTPALAAKSAQPGVGHKLNLKG